MSVISSRGGDRGLGDRAIWPPGVSGGGGGGGGIGGSIADQQVAFGNGTDITGNSDLIFEVGHELAQITVGFGSGPGLLIDGFHSQIRFPGSSNPCLTVDSNTVDLGNPNQTQGIHIDMTTGGSATIDLNMKDGQALNILPDKVNVDGFPIKLVPHADPVSPEEGMIWAGTDHHLYYFNGTIKKQLDN